MKSGNNTVSESLSGLLLLNKPAGVTSFDCVQFSKRCLGAHKVGHCGTLDPAARGLLILLVGAATRTQETFMSLEKEYWFKARLGQKTPTGDRESAVMESRPVDHISRIGLEALLPEFVGDLVQLPPLFSALKFKGKPYYRYAREGKDVPRIPRPIKIHSMKLLAFDLPHWEGQVVCSRGTYVRTLVEDIGERLGSCATLVDLERTRIGPYLLADAIGWQDLRTLDAEKLKSMIRPVAPGQPVILNA